MAEFPSEEDLEDLPSQAIVIYAARLARRVQPLYQEASGIEDHKIHSLSIDTVIRLTLNWSNRDGVNDEDPDASTAMYAAGNAAFAGYDAASNAATAAATAALATYCSPDATAAAAKATTYAAADAIQAIDDTTKAAAAAANVDYQKLLSMNLTEEDGIDGSEDGPLGRYWPTRLEPDWYREFYPLMQDLLDEEESKGLIKIFFIIIIIAVTIIWLWIY